MKLLTLVLSVAIATGASAANFTTQRFAVDYKITQHRTIEVTESIDVTFTIPQHGLIRKIPVRTQGQDRTTRYISVFLGGVEADYGNGFQPEQATTQTDGDLTIRIGTASANHTGPAKYRIHYSIEAGLTDIANGDAMGPRTELYWNVIPTGWASSIDHAEGSIQFPTPQPGDVAARFLIGTSGSRHGVEVHLDGKVVGGNPALKATFDGSTKVTFTTTQPIEKGVGITAVVGLPAGTVDAAPAESSAPSPEGAVADRLTAIPNSPVGYFLPLLGLPIIYLLAKPRFAPKTGPLVVQFEPPEGIGASECGLLIDHSVDQRDIVAGIVALAQKGAARMQHAGPGVAGVTVELLPVANARNLTPFEQQLYDSLTPFGPVIAPESLQGAFYPYYSFLVNQLYQESVQEGWYRSAGNGAKSGIGCLLGLAALVGAILLFPLFGFPAVIGILIAWIGGAIIVSQTSNLLPLGAKLRAQCLGLREFITRAHQREMNYMANKMPDQAMFEELLPYAVVFDAVKQWTQAFDGISLQPPDWYYGYDGTDMLWTYLLMDDLLTMNNDYGQAIATPPVSSFGSGGGFSDHDSGFGGGFSGGSDSGGSWDSGGSFDSGGSVDSGGGGGDSW